MRFADVILRGNRAGQPAANAVSEGTIYYVTDENVTERSSGSAWEDISDSGSAGITQLTGDATAGPGSGSQALTLADTAVTPGTYGDDSNVAQITVDSKGRIIDVTDVPITGGGGGGTLIQTVNTQSGAVATSSTIIPFDDTIPQNTEGAQILTRTITPTNALNILEIDIVIFATVTMTPWIITALFKDSDTDALAVAASFNNLSTAGITISFRHTMVAGGTSEIIFKVRVGPSSAATVTINGQSGGRIFGGVAASSITVRERTP